MESKSGYGSDLRVVVDKRGRTFEAGVAVSGRADVVVACIRKIGNFVTVSFGPAERLPVVPGPITMHTDDLRTFAE